MPNSAIASIRRLVAIGRRMNTSEKFMGNLGSIAGRRRRRRKHGTSLASPEPMDDTVEISIDDRAQIQRDQWRKEKTADHRHAERPPRLAPCAPPECDRHVGGRRSYLFATDHA